MSGVENAGDRVVTDFLDWLAGLPDALLLVSAGLLIFGETTLGLGFVAPGETGLVIVGTTATTVPRFLGIWSVTSTSAVLGYSGGYLIGKFLGPRIRATRLIREHGADGWDKAVELLRRRGIYAVMIAIYLPVVRTLVPAAAGAAGVPFRKFLPAAAIAGSSWTALHIALGALLGEAARKVEDVIGFGSWIVLGVIVVGFALVIVRRRRKARQEKTAVTEDSGPQPPVT